MSDFWEYQYTNVWDMQEYIAEFLVGKALGIDHPMNTDGWTLYDLEYRGKRIEVKETSYYHSWQEKWYEGKVSQVRTFDVHKSYSVYKDNTSELKRNNDIYVFCLNTGTNRETSNPLCMENWDLYVVPTLVINAECKDKKSVSLNRIRKFAKVCRFEELKECVDEAIEMMTNE